MKRLTTTGAGFTLAFLIAAGAAVTALQPAAVQPRSCLHGSDETPEQANRKRQALQNARQINTAEANLFRPNNRYSLLGDLGVQSSPSGFAVNLVADANGYVFSIKDTQDPCFFAFFSDQDGVIYSAQPIR
jgi:hypothetical protein